MTAALDELRRRVGGGVRGIAGAEARISTTRAQQQLTEQARDNPTLLGVAGVVIVGAVAYSIYAAIRNARERNKHRSRLKRGVKQARKRLEEGVEVSRRQLERQLERARPRGVLLKVEPENSGYMRVTEARLDVPTKDKGRSDVIKKLLWAAFLSIFMAAGSVLARRAAGSVWKATVREDPPSVRNKPED